MVELDRIQLALCKFKNGKCWLGSHLHLPATLRPVPSHILCLEQRTLLHPPAIPKHNMFKNKHAENRAAILYLIANGIAVTRLLLTALP